MVGARHHSLINIKRSEPPGEEEVALPLLVQSIHIRRPVEPAVQEHTQVFTGTSVASTIMQTSWQGGFDLLKSPTISLVLVVFRRRQSLLLQSLKASTRSCPLQDFKTQSFNFNYSKVPVQLNYSENMVMNHHIDNLLNIYRTK